MTRIIQDSVNETIFNEYKNMTVAEFREWLLDTQTTPDMIRRASRGLTSEIVAGVCKLMSNLDLIYAAKKMRVTAHCNTTIGLPGTFSSRLQPNHTTDDPNGIIASVMEGLSLGCGDAVIGLNPVDDSVESVARILKMFDEFKRKWEVPTQICVLAHVTTQTEAANKFGAPLDLMFQSIAGSQKGNEAFGLNAAMLDEGRATMLSRGTCTGPNVMYFETGQGSELSSEAHNGWDQVTMEARCYGFRQALQPLPGQHRRRLHRARVPVRFQAGHPRRPGGSLHGQADRHPHGLRRLLHQPHEGRPERHREPGDPAGGRRLQLHHGRARGRRLHADVPVHRLP